MTDQSGDGTERDASVVHCEDMDCPPVVVDITDSFGSRDSYLDYATAEDLHRQLGEVLRERENAGTGQEDE